MGLITPELGTFVWMFLAFAIVLFLLKKFAWKPILSALKEREDSIEGALRSAERAKEEMAELQADNERILQEARKEREAMLKEAKEMGSTLVSEAKQKATLEADKVIESARLNIENEKSVALGEIKALVANLSVEIAEKILRQKFADDQQQKDYFKKLMDEVKLN
jgi:F-type H+-transporting ATPase subunit b